MSTHAKFENADFIPWQKQRMRKLKLYFNSSFQGAQFLIN